MRNGKVLVGLLFCAVLYSLAAQTPPSKLSSATALGTGARVDYSAAKNLIVFDQAGADTYFDVYTQKTNATAKTCMTCTGPIPQQQTGNPAWDPSSQFILFQSQDPALAIPPNLMAKWYRASNPGFGTNNNLWLMKSDASQMWQLTTVTSGMGVLHAQWSHDGKHIVYAQKLSSVSGAEQWNIQLADINLKDVVPSLSNARSIAPFGVSTLYETHSFSPDDSKILFSSGDPANPQVLLDLYTFNLTTSEVQNLTNSPGIWDEHAHYTPDGTKIVWGSSRDIAISRTYFVPFTDYWSMNADGTNQQRLTYFNTAGYPEYYPNGLVSADFAFGPTSQFIISSLEKNQVPPPASSMIYYVNILKLIAPLTGLN